MKAYIIFILFILIQCNNKVEKLFNDNRVEMLFLEFYNEVKNNNEYENNDILIYSNGSEQEYNLYFSNIDSNIDLSNNKVYLYYNYKGTNIYIDSYNFPTNILLLKGKNYMASIEDNDDLPIIKDYIELHIFMKNDTIRYKKINFDNTPYSDKWMLFKNSNIQNLQRCKK